MADNQNVKYYCPTCKSELKLISGCGSVSYFCEKCNRTMGAEQFYGSNNLKKYPEGKMKQCKKCMTMHVDNWNPETYLWILQEVDVPYVPDEWNK